MPREPPVRHSAGVIRDARVHEDVGSTVTEVQEAAQAAFQDVPVDLQRPARGHVRRLDPRLHTGETEVVEPQSVARPIARAAKPRRRAPGTIQYPIPATPDCGRTDRMTRPTAPPSCCAMASETPSPEVRRLCCRWMNPLPSSGVYWAGTVVPRGMLGPGLPAARTRGRRVATGAGTRRRRSGRRDRSIPPQQYTKRNVVDHSALLTYLITPVGTGPGSGG